MYNGLGNGCGNCWIRYGCSRIPIDTENGIYCEFFRPSASNGLKIGDVVRPKNSVWMRSISPEKTYIIEDLCNGLVSMKDVENPGGKLYLNYTDNLTYIGSVKECIEFKDKSLCLI